jgi:PAP2 superfamily
MTNFGGFARALLLESLLNNATFAAFMALSLVLILRPKQSEMGSIITLVLVILIAADTGILARPIAQLSLGLVPLLAILPRSRCDRSYGTARLYFVIVGSLLLPLASSLALIGQQLTVYHAKTFDIPAYLIDNSYGLSANATLGELTWAHPALHQSVGIIYGWLPATISTCYALNVRAGNRDAGNLLKAALAGGAIAFVLYHFYPAAGPIYAFGQAFPASLPDPATLAPIPAGLAVPDAARNCMPSVHFVWAMLAAAEARALGKAWRASFILFALLTAFATIALGEHYVIDLVVAVPFTLCVHALCSRERPWLIGWRMTAVSGGVATMCWLLFLRIWTPPPHVSFVLWTLTLLTIAGSVLLRLGHLSYRPGFWRQRVFCGCETVLGSAEINRTEMRRAEQAGRL